MLALVDYYPYALVQLLSDNDEVCRATMAKFKLDWDADVAAKTSGVPHVVAFVEDSAMETRLMQNMARAARYDGWEFRRDSLIVARLRLIYDTWGQDHRAKGHECERVEDVLGAIHWPYHGEVWGEGARSSRGRPSA